MNVHFVPRFTFLTTAVMLLLLLALLLYPLQVFSADQPQALSQNQPQALSQNQPQALSQNQSDILSSGQDQASLPEGTHAAETIQKPAATPENLLLQLNDYPHAVRVAVDQRAVVDHEIGLGTLKKVRGVWQFKHSERQSGVLSSYTWQIVDGFASAEVLAELVARVEDGQEASLLFQCEGRACGQGAQWANRVFRQRVLYGREDLQRYRVYTIGSAAQYRLVMFSAARTAERQYLHVELLEITAAAD